jgi:uncharacterized protein
MRTVASLGAYLATTDEDGIQLQMYAPSTVETGGVRLAVETEYPWDGVVRVRVLESPEREWTLSMRVPPWAQGAVLQGDGVEAGGYAQVRRAWRSGDVVELRLPMTVRVTTAGERIDAVRGCVALERGPLVYAVEHPAADDLAFAGVTGADFRPGLLGGVTVVGLSAWVRVPEERPWPYGPDGSARPGERAEVEAVPYFAWANRGIGPMRVWLPDGRRPDGVTGR